MGITSQEIIENRNELQRQVLGETTEGNSRLPTSGPAKLTLDTTNKILTKAVNELNTNDKNVNMTVDAFNERLSNLVGRENTAESIGGDKEIFEYLKEKLDLNVLKMILKLDQQIYSIDGETTPASNRESFEYRNLDNTKMNINQYADRSPNSWTGSENSFNEAVFEKLQDNNSKYDGIYYIPEN